MKWFRAYQAWKECLVSSLTWQPNLQEPLNGSRKQASALLKWNHSWHMTPCMYFTECRARFWFPRIVFSVLALPDNIRCCVASESAACSLHEPTPTYWTCICFSDCLLPAQMQCLPPQVFPSPSTSNTADNVCHCLGRPQQYIFLEVTVLLENLVHVCTYFMTI